MDAIQVRTLIHNKGVVISGTFQGKDMVTATYRSKDGKRKNIEIRRDQECMRGDTFYAHINDENNELLILSDEQFPY